MGYIWNNLDRGHSRYWKSHHLIDHIRVPLGLSCITYETKRDIRRKSRSFLYPLHLSSLLSCSRRNIGTDKVEWWSTRRWTSLRIRFLISTRAWSTYGPQTDRRTDTARRHRPRYA